MNTTNKPINHPEADVCFPSSESNSKTIKKPQLFLDCDGVLADFDSRAITLLGEHPRQAEVTLGTEAFWQTLRNQNAFFRDLPKIRDADLLYRSVAHLNPIILTGCPAGEWAEEQKLAWAQEHFPGVRMITCRSKDKRLHMSPGDILIDDYLQYRHLWLEAGGIFIHHQSAKQSLEELSKYIDLISVEEGGEVLLSGACRDITHREQDRIRSV